MAGSVIDLERLVDHLEEARLWLDERGQVLRATRAALSLLAQAAGDVVQRGFAELFAEADRGALTAWVAQLDEQPGRTIDAALLGAGGRVRLVGALVPGRPRISAISLQRVREGRADARAGARLQALADLGALLALELPLDEALDRAAGLAAAAVGDWATIHRVLPGQPHEMAVVSARHREEARAEDMGLLAGSRGPRGARTAPGIAEVARTLRPRLLRDLPQAQRLDFAGSAERLELLDRVGFGSGCVVPLASRTRVLGVLTVGAAAAGVFSEDDLAFVIQLADRLAWALSREELVRELGRERMRLARVLDQLPEAVVIQETSGRFLWNESARKLGGSAIWPPASGWPYAGLLFDAHGQLVPDEELPLPAAFTASIEQREYTLRRDEGPPLTLLVNAVPLQDDGRTAGAVAVYQDISRRKEAERRARILADVTRILLETKGSDEKEALRRIVSRVATGLGDWCRFSLIRDGGRVEQVAAHHPDGRQRELIDRLLALVPLQHFAGESLDAALLSGETIRLERLDFDAAPQLPQAAREILDELQLGSMLIVPMRLGGESIGTMELASIGPDGHRYTPADLEFASELGERASLAVRNARLAKALQQEREDLRAARDDAERRAAQLQAVLDASPNGVVLFDADDRLHYASPQSEAILGRSFADDLGRTAVELFSNLGSAADGVDPVAMRQRALALFDVPGRTLTEEVEFTAGPRSVRCQATPVRREDGSYVGRLLMYTDITEQRALDRQRSDFLTVASHELRTPLTPLSMQIQTIHRRLLRGEQIEPGIVAKARRQVDRLAELIDELLDFSRMESGRLAVEKQPLAFDELAIEIAADFRSVSPAHEIRVETSTQVLVEGDRQRLEQVLVNLIQNAVKYSPKGGPIDIAVDVRDGEAHLSVRDRGIGVPAEEHHLLFQRFFRARNAVTSHFSGLGVGLYISQEIVLRHGGRISLDSQVGEGSTFHVLLPLAQEPLPQRR